MMRIIRIKWWMGTQMETTISGLHSGVAPAELTHANGESRRHRPELNSRVLFAGGREIVIFHYGEPYCLRETRQGKLILTK
jgi:hemin uptake protein HemP